jgi:predicted GH43/DUF377 family glycosyl hydrolase
LAWQKRGHIYSPDPSLWWAKSHAHVPTAYLMDDCIRVFYTGLDEHRYGRIGYVDLERDNPSQIRYIAPEPVLELGDIGCFDDSGLVPSYFMPYKDRFYLYYIGFQRAERVPYMLFTGLATSTDGTHFERYSRSPILDRTANEPFSRSAPCIIIEGTRWRMWYWSALAWQQDSHGIHYQTVIRHASSEDGIHWQASPEICISPYFPDEYAVGRPWVMKTETVYKMWYSMRSHTKGYRMGYAESVDGLRWRRLDAQMALDVSETGWDSEMVCYPCTVSVDGELLLFYNGNRHGYSGFGYAVWSKNS